MDNCRCREKIVLEFFLLFQLWHENTFLSKDIQHSTDLWCRYILCCQQTDIWHEAFISTERGSDWATIPAICTNFKLIKTTSCVLKEHQSTFTTHLQCWQHDRMSSFKEWSLLPQNISKHENCEICETPSWSISRTDKIICKSKSRTTLTTFWFKIEKDILLLCQFIFSVSQTEFHCPSSLFSTASVETSSSSRVVWKGLTCRGRNTT